MDPRVNKLIAAFESNGWISKGTIDISSDWWFTDITELHSNWRPVNTAIYLTLLVDPQITKEKQVWSIGISTNIPNNRLHEWIDQISLNDISRIDLTVFVKSINDEVLLNI